MLQSNAVSVRLSPVFMEKEPQMPLQSCGRTEQAGVPMLQSHMCGVVPSPTAKTEEPPSRQSKQRRQDLPESVTPCGQIKAGSVSSCPSSLLPWALSISPRGANTCESGVHRTSTPNGTFMGITSADLHSSPGRVSSPSHCGPEELSDSLTVPKPRL